jgi:hypothetical protein
MPEQAAFRRNVLEARLVLRKMSDDIRELDRMLHRSREVLYAARDTLAVAQQRLRDRLEG